MAIQPILSFNDTGMLIEDYFGCGISIKVLAVKYCISVGTVSRIITSVMFANRRGNTLLTIQSAV